MRGWILDCYADEVDNEMVTWVRTSSGVERIADREYRPSFYVRPSPEKKGSLLLGLREVGIEHRWERHRTWLTGPLEDVLKVTPRGYRNLMPLARTVDRWGCHRDHTLFNVDTRMDTRYFLHRKVFPMGLMDVEGWRNLDSPFRLDYPMPDLRICELGLETSARRGMPTMEDRLRRVTLDDIVIEGKEADILETLQLALREKDPDVLLTDGGDSFHLPFLERCAERNEMGLELGREGGKRRGRGKSYFTYGRILYKPPAYKLRGRIHLDKGSSFIFQEGGMAGLIDLCRLSRISPQDMARMSPGSAISAMQVNEATRMGSLVMWKKNLPEDFKTAVELVASDRGGLIYEPEVGLHERVQEVDFTSLYPSIMVRHNISPETLNCECCKEGGEPVPGLGYWTCSKRKGMLGRVLEPVVRRRIAFKRLRREGGRHSAIYDQRAKVLKWVLVTCFGYTGYRNARFGRIECHESITAHGREILLRSAEIAERKGFRILHGIVDSLWLEGDGDIEPYCQEIGRRMGIPLVWEGEYRWIVFLPNLTNGAGALNRYYGVFQDGELKVRGIALRRRDTCTLARELQRDMLDRLSLGEDAEGFRHRVPEALDLLDSHLRHLRDMDVPLQKLVLSKRITRELREYRQRNDQFRALCQLEHQGFRTPPGEAVEFIMTPGREVKVAQFLDGKEEYDVGRYEELLFRAAGELLSPFDLGQERLRDFYLREGRK
jgi:DNA polymerase-2